MSFLLNFFKSPKKEHEIPTYVNEVDTEDELEDVKLADVESNHSDNNIMDIELESKSHAKFSEDEIKQRKEYVIKMSIRSAYEKKIAFLKKEVETKLIEKINVIKFELQNNLTKKINDEENN